MDKNRPSGLLPAILWALFIAILCGIPGRDLPHFSFLDALAPDKWVHAGLFFILHALWLCAAPPSSSRWKYILVCILYGGLLEILQGLIFSERTADPLDFLANSAGVLLFIPFREKWIPRLRILLRQMGF